MQNKRSNLGEVTPVFNQLLKQAHSVLEREFINTFMTNPLVNCQKFPISDTYVYFEDEEQNVVQKIEVKFYLAGYRKEDVQVALNPNNTFTVSGEVQSENQHFPTDENIKRFTQGASKKKFSATYSIVQNYELSECNMEDGVLNITFLPQEDKKAQKIEIK